MRTAIRVLLALCPMACAGTQAMPPPEAEAPSPGEPDAAFVTAVADVDWQKLNPARGDKSPQAATLWGDRNDTVATGFLFHAKDGFESPPHIHNVSYRGVVIGGHIHNAHPEAIYQWMPPGSYWTQPEGEVHITSARGTDVLAYIEIDEGPYLVRPVDQAFESGEPTLNLMAPTIPWRSGPGELKTAPLWDGDRGQGHLVKVPAGSELSLRTEGPLQVVTVAGSLEHRAQALAPGSYLRFSGGVMSAACSASGACVLYVRSAGPLESELP